MPTLTAKQLEDVLEHLISNGMHPDPVLKHQIYRYIYGATFTNISEDPLPPPPQPKKESPPVSEQLPKEQLLLKLLKMTTSSNDGEALTAIRKVNTILTDNGWDWDKFVAGKIKIVENPFVGLSTPPRRESSPTPVRSPVRPAPPPSPPRAPRAGQRVKALGLNRYADYCYCCGIEVMAQAGGFFKREDYNLNAKYTNPRSPFSVVCASCESTQMIWDQPAPPLRKKGKASINDLA